jgi:hypothetical protein
VLFLKFNFKHKQNGYGDEKKKGIFKGGDGGRG